MSVHHNPTNTPVRCSLVAVEMAALRRELAVPHVNSASPIALRRVGDEENIRGGETARIQNSNRAVTETAREVRRCEAVG